MSLPTAAAAQFAQEKGTEGRGLLAPPPLSPPGYCSVYQPPVNVIQQDRPRNARCRRRFWHFLACTFLFIGTLHLLSGKHFHAGWFSKSKYFHGRKNNGPWQCSDTVNWTTGEHDGPHGYPYYATTSLSLPLDADELAFLADGDLSHGVFEVSQTADSGSNAVVDVEVSYLYPEALDDATVCRLHPAENRWGLGIYTPHWRRPHRERTLRFHVHVRIPAGTDKLVIDNLRTDLPLFSHLLKLNDADDDGSVYFDRISLRTENSPIEVNTLVGNVVRAQSSNAAIRGSFKTDTELDLETSNAPITVHAELTNGDENTTKLYLKTSNGRIDSDIVLLSNTSDSDKGNFLVSAKTSNAPLTLSFLDAPIDSTLTTTAHTSNAPAQVTLHKTYEGSFSLSSSAFFRPTVEWSDVEDPAGLGRKRKVVINTIRGGTVHGSAAWEEGGENRGSVQVETSNSPLHLIL